MSMIHRRARWTGLFLVATLTVAGASCGGGGGDGPTGPGGGSGPTVSRIDLTPGDTSILIGQTSSFTASPKDAAGAAISGQTISWSTSDQKIAAVSGGVVTGVTAGSATITAAVGTVHGSVVVTVLAPVATIALAPDPDTIVVGATSQLTLALKDAAGATITGRTVSWGSSNDLVATVSASGLVTSKTLGSAVITASVEGKKATAAVVVIQPPVASVAVTPPASTLVVGGTVQLGATTKDSAGTALTGRAVTWTSSDESIATVTPSGSVTARAVGPATITATSEGKSATVQITVTRAPVQTVAVAPNDVPIKPGATTQLTATVSDASGIALTGRDITWSTSDSSKAKITGSGATITVTGVAYGVVTITATSEGKTGKATVKVGDGIAPVLVGLTTVPSPVDVTSGTKSVTVTAHVTDAGGSGVAQFAVKAVAPHGAFTDCVDTTLDSGTTNDGYWSCNLTIPIGAEPGDWQLLVLISDAGYASSTYSGTELTKKGAPTSFNVVSNWDRTYPVFHSLTVTPATVSVAGGAQTVTVSANLTDDRSGIAQFDFVATSPSGSQVKCSASTPASGDMLNGTWTCAVTIPAGAEAGTWNITVRAADRAFNSQTYGPQPEGGSIAFPSGYPTAITVTR